MTSLSNTATPKYYGIFRDRVLRGELPVCKELSMEMNRIDSLIKNPAVYYDPDPVEGWVNFCEAELTKTDGSDLVLLDSFKLWGEQIFGWYYFETKYVYEPSPNGRGGRYVKRVVKKRLTKKQYLIVARGAAKTMYALTLQAYFLTVDTTTTQQVTTAPTMKQANEVITPIATAISRSRGPLFKFLTMGSMQNTTGNKSLRPKLASTKKGIENSLTNSILEVRPMSIDKLQGLRVAVATVDEWLSGEVREDVIAALEQGGSKMEDYLIVATSSEGTVRSGIGDTIKMELASILKGDYQNMHTSIFHYKLDDITEVENPDLWLKAQPNLGLTVSYESYQLDVDRAIHSPHSRNDILAKRFGIPMEGYTYFFTYQETIPGKKRTYFDLPCALGLDGSQGDDFYAFTFLFPLPRGLYGIKTRCYISQRTMDKLPAAMHDRYIEFIKEGTLVVFPGSVLDVGLIYEDLSDFIELNGYDVRTLGYDPYNAEAFLKRWIADNGEHNLEKVIQGARTESVPLGEIKKLSEDGSLLFDEELMGYALGNAIAVVDTNGNIKLSKMRYDQKIDAASALLDAYIALKLHQDQFD